MECEWRLSRRIAALRMRDGMTRAIRLFFQERGYLEVDTPLRIPAPIPEEHINAVPSGDWFLHTSPEICMKRLLACGYPGIFQICKCFREGERGRRHLPEFTLLEWYQPGVDYTYMMEECEELIRFVAQNTCGSESLVYQGQKVDLHRAWERITVREAFEIHASVSLEEALADGSFDEQLAINIEPCLGLGRPVFLYDYPVSLGALARPKKENPQLAERFELYIAGMELANAFSELTDSDEQRKRFRNVQQYRQKNVCKVYPEAEPFLRSLENLPDCAGVALGVDRLAMLFADKLNIAEVVSLTPEEL